MKKVFTLILLIAFALPTFAQEKEGDEIEKAPAVTEVVVDDPNLVKNPGFEDNNGKLKKLGQLDYADEWSKTTKIKSDLFTKNGLIPDISVPTNAFAKQAQAKVTPMPE